MKIQARVQGEYAPVDGPIYCIICDEEIINTMASVRFCSGDCADEYEPDEG